MLELFQQCGICCFITLLEQFKHMIEISKKYHTVGTVPRYDRNKQNICGVFCLFLSYIGTVPLELSQQFGIFVYFYHMFEPFQSCGIFSFSLDQYVVIKHRNSIKLIPLHIRINRSNPPHFTACANPLSQLSTPYVAVFLIFGFFHFVSCSCITLRDPCNNQRPRCDTAWLHVTHH
jgi:hypothetical protein